MIIAFTCGIVLGFIFFGGLWLTIRKTIGSNNTALWMLVSTLIRTVTVLTGFYLVAQGNMQRLLLALAGFIAARFLVMYLTRQFDQKKALLIETSPL